jgi:hypothetical protein
MRVDLGRSNVCMPKLLLHRSNVGATFEQMCCERVTQRMTAGRLCDAALQHRGTHRLLYTAFVDMMTARCAGTWIDAQMVRGEYVLPRPLDRCIRIFSF